MNDQTSTSLDIISQALAELAANKTATDLIYSDIRFLEFKAKKGENNYGKGFIFTGQGTTKQLVFNPNPDQFFSSENININKGKHLAISGVKVLDETELGSTVTKSNLRQLGRLKSLLVDGPVNINSYLFYNSSVDRLGLGIEAPHAAFSVAENAIEVMVGTDYETGHGIIGTYASHDLDIVTGNTARITVKSNGDISFGAPLKGSTQVTIHGKLSVGVETPDPSVDLHVSGPVKLNNHLQMYAAEPPKAGNYTIGDIVWNSNPRVKGCIGWVCLKAGSPGVWNPFGEIKENGN